MISHLSLQEKDSLSQFVSLHTDKNNLEFLIINHPNFDAAVTLHGAHLLHFQPKQQAPIIWLSKDTIFSEDVAIRGGVPVCWPWFGPAPKSPGKKLPNHGFARTSKWSLTDIKEAPESLVLELSLQDSVETRKLWPFNFELLLKITFTDTVKLELISTNTGSETFTYRAALHSYLNISTPEKCAVSGLNTHRKNMLDGGKIEIANGRVQIDAPIDAIYEKSQDKIAVDDNGFNRQLNVVNSGNDSEVVWNPWIEGAKAFSDMPDDGYKTMLCVESAITREAGESISAGKSHTLTTIIG